MPLAGGMCEMLLSLGGTVGVGNISGVAVALAIGGAGAVFWMWVGAFVSMALKYAEITLGMRTRCRTAQGYVGGAAHYIKTEIGSLAATLFTVLLLIDCVTMGGMIQSSAIAEAAETAFGLSPLVCGIAVSLLAAAVFFFGMNVFRLSAYVVPAMSIGYLLCALAVIVVYARGIPDVLRAILAGAFAPSAATGGAFGFLCSPALRQGIVKGLFSNEAGCGTAPTAHIAAKETVPARQGLFGILEVFVDTVLMCSLTAFVILLTSGEMSELSELSGGAAICARAFAALYGNAAPAGLAIFLFLFAFAAMISFGYYGAQSLAYFGLGKKSKDAFLVFFCFSLLLGSVCAPRVIWSIADAVICMMLLLNTAAVFVGRNKVFAAHGELRLLYVRHAHMGK